MADEPTMCSYCGLAVEDGQTRHETSGDCVARLRTAMLKQRESASMLAFEVSTRILAAIEGLAHDPSVGMLRYSFHNADTDEVTQLHPQVVQGLLLNILGEYKKMGEWSPLRDAQDKAADLHSAGHELLRVVRWTLAEHRGDIGKDLVSEAEAAVELAMQHGVHQPGPGHS